MKKTRTTWLCIGGGLVAIGTIIVSTVKLCDAVVILNKLATEKNQSK